MSGEEAEVLGAKGVVGEPIGEELGAEAEDAPIGTLFFMVIFLILMVALWGTTYWMLLKR